MPAVQSKLGTTHGEMLRHFTSVVWSSRRGKLLTVSLLAALAGSTAYGALKNRERDSKEKKAKRKAKRNTDSSNFLKDLLSVLRVAFPSPTATTSVHLYLYSLLLCARILLTIKIADVTGSLGKTVGAKSFSQMFDLQVTFGLWCIPAAVTNSLLHYEQSKLSISIRERLTRYCHGLYLRDLVFYRASNLGNKMEDVDSRTTQECKRFSSQVVDTYGNILKPVLEVIFISRTLAQLMGGKHLMVFFAFFLLAGQYLRWIMPRFSVLTALAQKKEAAFRANHRRVITHSEEIAFYGGGERECEILDDSFSDVKRVHDKTFFLRIGMGVLDQYIVKYGAAMVAYSLMMPTVYLGLHGLKDKSAPEIMKYYITSTNLFVALGAACKHLVLSYKRIQDLSGLTIRMSGLIEMLHARAGGFDGKEDVEAMKALAKANEDATGGEPRILIGNEIRFEHVDLFSPTGALLVKDLSFAVEQGSNVLVSGPNGSGKSSLFRVVGGLWPLCSGTMTKPAQQDLFYIPQAPYLAPGSLQDQITYPLHVPGTAELRVHLAELLEMVNLSYLVDREGGWDTVREWKDVLSGGEKQRVAMARLFYHKPKFGILDECTSAVSIDTESMIYENCKKLNITIFTVSHRAQLRHHHNRELAFDGLGGWKWLEL